MTKVTQIKAPDAAKKLESATHQEALKWDIEKFSSWLCFASSFGFENVVIDMFTRLNPSR